MSHIDDGQLHAYLDGDLVDDPAARDEFDAHLSVCSECRARLVAARGQRVSAEEVLALLVPGEAKTPSFDALLARRQATAPADVVPMGDVGNSGRWRVERLAWAAGIVVALGGGWMAHAVTRPVVGPPLRSAPVEAGQAAAKQESATEVVLGQSEERLAPTEGATTPVTQAAPAAPPSPPGAMADAGTPAARAQSAPSADAAGAAAPAPALDEIVITGTAGAARRREVGNALASAEAAPAQPSVDGLRLFLEGQVAVAGTDEEAIERVLTRWEGAAQTESAWVLVAPAEAARILGRAPLELEGLPWERMEGAVTASGDVLVRTVHPLPDGRRVSLVQGPWDVPQAGATDLADRREILPLRPLAAAPEVAARAESAAPSLGVGRWMGPLIVRLYGPLQMAELVGLAARLR